MIKTVEQIANEIAASDDLQKDMQVLKKWAKSIVRYTADNVKVRYESSAAETECVYKIDEKSVGKIMDQI